MTVEDLIAKWEGTPGGAEKKNFPLFINDLCAVIGVAPPSDPAASGVLGEYEYEAPVPKGSFRSLDASGAIDLYKRRHFIMEAKQSYLKPEQIGLDLGEDARPRAPSGARYDKLMRDARLQAENYAKNLPAAEPVAPFLIVCDIGRAFEIYHDSAGNGRGYTFFPDKQSYRIELKDLASDRKLKGPDKTPFELLKAIWTDPRSIDPRFQSADVTRTVAQRLASVSQYIEEGLKLKLTGKSAREKSVEVEEAALFLMRILFCMFAEDIGLLPRDKFKDFLLRAESNDKLFQPGLSDLWVKMGAPNVSPRFAHAVEDEVKYFNGGLFSETARTYPLGGFVIHDLYEAARQNWRKVEPAIFGTLLEQALTSEERAKLGAHYTPRPYVETLVRATIMDVLEPEWHAIETGEEDGMLERAQAFHERLATIRVLDPACGTGNFLYVSMELMQALESKVIETIQTLGGTAEPKVGPHQFHGLEKNPRAAKIAELVLWIGWLRNRLHDDPDSVPQPVLAESASINFGLPGGYDAVLKMNALGEPDLENPMIPDWPEAEFIIGNPPFIAGQDLREELGDDYAEALWNANPRVAGSADFVMQWWDRAAHTLVANDSPLRRFGFVTTNSITQQFSRRVISGYLGEKGGGLSLVMSVPDHPWIKKPKEEPSSTRRTRKAGKVKGPAAVRIAMTVAQLGQSEGLRGEVESETNLDTDQPNVQLRWTSGRINADLSVDLNVVGLPRLLANRALAHKGFQLNGSGFVVDAGRAKLLEASPMIAKRYFIGSDLNTRDRGLLALDLHGLSESEARTIHPKVYEYLLATVRPERLRNPMPYRRDNWWLFGQPSTEIRQAVAGLQRVIATPRQGKYRLFIFVPPDSIIESTNVVIASDQAWVLGVLSSTIHEEFSLRTGGWMGVGNDPRYFHTTTFFPFPFPAPNDAQCRGIGALAEELDQIRRNALAAASGLSMTDLYNLRQKLRNSEKRSPDDDRQIQIAQVRTIDRLHEQLDQAVADAYGWGEEWRAGALGPSEIVARLVALNHERAAEEAEGKVRWLRSEYQEPRFGKKK